MLGTTRGKGLDSGVEGKAPQTPQRIRSLSPAKLGGSSRREPIKRAPDAHLMGSNGFRGRVSQSPQLDAVRSFGCLAGIG